MGTIKKLNLWDLKVVSQKVTKHQVGERSSFQMAKQERYWFEAHFTFNTGSEVSIQMVEPRKEFKNIPTMEIDYSDIEKATKIALEDYNNAMALLSNPAYLYTRAVRASFYDDSNKYSANIYGKDEKSPTGVILLGSCSSIKLADYVIEKLGLSGGGALSPTENKMSAKY